jgi:hypothetical protein
MRSLANFEAANKKLETAKGKNKGVPEAEAIQQTCSSKFDKISETGKQGEREVFLLFSPLDAVYPLELQSFKERRVAAFKKNLVSLYLF